MKMNLPTCSWVTVTVARDVIFSLSAGGGPVFSSCPKSYKKKKKKRQRRSGRHRTIPREGAAPSENSADIRNVSCFGFHKALRGLGLPFPAARIIVLQFQSDISISLQTDPLLQGSPLGIKQLGGSKRVVMSQIKLHLNRKWYLTSSKTSFCWKKKVRVWKVA